MASAGLSAGSAEDVGNIQWDGRGMNEAKYRVAEALDHVRALAGEIGPRGSCTAAEEQAAEYAAAAMRCLGLQGAAVESFRGSPSTYRPFALAFATALLAALLAQLRWAQPHVWLPAGRWVLAAAALLSGLGAWGMLRETDLAPNWLRRVLPRGASQNAVGVVPPQGAVRRRAVLCAHLDSHRTPIFYSSPAWLRLFSILVGAALASMGAAALLYALGGLFGWTWVRWPGLAAAGVELLALALCLHADRTAFSPGANDNASGVGVALALAARLCHEPPAHTEVWLALTGCEETGAAGMAAFLDAHAAALGPDVLVVVLDQVGIGHLVTLTADGLVRKHRTHPRALAVARAAHGALPGLVVKERTGIAYTDALVATKRGLAALTIVALAPRGGETHWHQVSDRPEHVEERCLEDACAFAWQILQQLDGTAEDRGPGA